MRSTAHPDRARRRRSRPVHLVGDRDREDAVDIDDDLAVSVRGVLPTQRPGAATGFGRCGPNGLLRFLAAGGESIDQAGEGRVGGDRAEDGRLTPQYRDVREAVQGDRQGRVPKSRTG